MFTIPFYIGNEHYYWSNFMGERNGEPKAPFGSIYYEPKSPIDKAANEYAVSRRRPESGSSPKQKTGSKLRGGLRVVGGLAFTGTKAAFSGGRQLAKYAAIGYKDLNKKRTGYYKSSRKSSGRKSTRSRKGKGKGLSGYSIPRGYALVKL